MKIEFEAIGTVVDENTDLEDIHHEVFFSITPEDDSNFFEIVSILYFEKMYGEGFLETYWINNQQVMAIFQNQDLFTQKSDILLYEDWLHDLMTRSHCDGCINETELCMGCCSSRKAEKQKILENQIIFDLDTTSWLPAIMNKYITLENLKIIEKGLKSIQGGIRQ